jgi:hypothetical protein
VKDRYQGSPRNGTCANPERRGLGLLGLLGLIGLIVLFAGLAAAGCKDDPPQPRRASSSGPPPTQRLHPPGELRLTSAGTEPRVRLRYRLVPGSRQGFRTWLKATHHAQGQSSRLTVRFDWERSVDQVRAQQARVTLRVRRVRRVRPASLRDSVAPRLGGVELRHLLDTRGRVSDLEPARSLGGLGGAGALTRFSAPLPEDAVGQGATWERSERWPLSLPQSHQRVRVGVRTRYQLTLDPGKGGALRRATIRATVRLTASPVEPGALTGQQVRGGGKGTAELRLDLKKGRITRGRSDQKISLTVVGYGRSQSLKQRLQTRTRAVRLPPPRR